MNGINLADLHHFLDTHYSAEELRTLCLALQCDYDNLAAAGKANKMRELIHYLNHRGRLDELIAYVRATRPHVPLTAVSPPPVPETVPPAAPVRIEAAAPARRALQESLQRGRLVIFWGGDLDSRLTGLPGRQQMADALARQHGLALGDSLPAVAQQVMRQGNRFAFTDFLREILDTTGKRPQPVHQSLVGLVRENQLALIITAAYDNLIELAFREAGLPLAVAVTDGDLRFAAAGAPTLIKLYGDRQQPASLVVTEQDENLLLRGQIREKSDLIDEVRRAFRRQPVLFVGYHLRGTAVTALFDEVTGDRFQLPAFAIDPELNESERAAWLGNRGLTIFDDDPAAFLHTLLIGG